jgi:DNA-binding response OmpR family regulator
MKILIVEDEKILAKNILSYLSEEGYICEVTHNYQTALEKINIYSYDCIIVDITLPDGNGLQIIRHLKEITPDSGVIIISAKNSLDDKITGLEIGSDDYLTKPFHLAELNARVKSLFRRRNFSGSNEIIFNEIKIVPGRRQVLVQKNEVSLTKKEYDLLLFFVSNQNKALTKESIAEHLWGDDIDGIDSFNFIYSHIKNLRRKLIENGSEDYLTAIYGIGYKFSKS